MVVTVAASRPVTAGLAEVAPLATDFYIAATSSVFEKDVRDRGLVIGCTRELEESPIGVISTMATAGSVASPGVLARAPIYVIMGALLAMMLLLFWCDWFATSATSDVGCLAICWEPAKIKSGWYSNVLTQLHCGDNV